MKGEGPCECGLSEQKREEVGGRVPVGTGRGKCSVSVIDLKFIGQLT